MRTTAFQDFFGGPQTIKIIKVFRLEKLDFDFSGVYSDVCKQGAAPCLKACGSAIMGEVRNVPHLACSKFADESGEVASSDLAASKNN